MADLADMAFEVEQSRLAGLLASRRAPIEAGVAGECEECGEDMPRLIGGRCGYCRDGRRPPLSRFDDAPKPRPIVAAAVSTTETIMTAVNTTDKQTISVPARGDVLAAIRSHADASDLPLGQAVIALVERGLATSDATASQPSSGTIHELTIAELAAEICARVENAVDVAALIEATERAETAERKLAAIQATLAGQ